MSTLPPEYRFPFDNPATYRIVVRGTLASSLSDRLEGMAIQTVVGKRGVTQSILVGELVDQAALAGVLRTLYDLHMVLTSVEQIPTSDFPGRPAQSNLEV
jgi:hypothetical protein